MRGARRAAQEGARRPAQRSGPERRVSGRSALPSVAAAALLLGGSALLVPAPAPAQPTGAVVVADDEVPSGESDVVGLAEARCGLGRVALGGGVATGAPALTRIDETAPWFGLDGGTPLRDLANGTYPDEEPLGWDGSATVEGNASSVVVKAAAVCVEGGEADASVDAIDLEPSTEGFAYHLFDACGPGEVASGGVGVEDVGGVWLTGTAPSYGGTRLFDVGDGEQLPADGWLLRARSGANGGNRMVKLGLLCAKEPGGFVQVASGDVAAGSVATVDALCPEGSVAIGGGVDTESEFDGEERFDELVESAPLLGTRESPEALASLAAGTHEGLPVGWRGAVRNRSGSAAHAFKVAAVCVPEPGRAAAAAATLGALAALARRRRSGRRSVCAL